MKKNIFSVTVVTIAFTFIFIACGGEEPEHPDDDQNNDEIAVTDDEPDNEQPDDVIDEENPDEDQVVIANCEKLLDIVGDWTSINIEGYDITVTVTPKEKNCEVAVEWTKGYSGVQKWYGLELPLTYWEEEAYRNYTLKKTGENLVREDTLKTGGFDNEWVFKKIQ